MTSEMHQRRKLHRAAIGAEVLDQVRQLAIPVVVIALVGGGGLGRILVLGLLGAVVAVVSAFLQWQTSWWSIEGDSVRLRRGVLSERITSIPFDRVQAVDTVRGPVQRLFDVVELHVQSAGGGRAGEIVLKAVTPAEAEEIRAAVRSERPAVAVEQTEDAVEWRLGRGPLLVAALTSGSLGVLVPVVAGASQVLDDVIGAEEAERFVPSSLGEAAVLAAAVLGLAWVLSFLGTIIAFAGFTAIRDGERIRIRRGIVERREASVPVARIHAVRIVESPLREPFGLAQVRIESAGYAAEPASAQTLVPLVRRNDVPRVLAELLPEMAAGAGTVRRAETRAAAENAGGAEAAAGSFPGPLAAPPPRALRRFVLPPLAAGLVVAAVPLAVFEADALIALVLPVAGAVLGVARYRAAGWRLDSGRLVLRSRRVARTTAIADPRRLQRVTGAQSVLQRRAGLGDVEVAVSSGRRVGVEHLDEPVARDLVGRLARAATRPPDAPRFGASPAG
jgi:putative membrane protein